MTKPLHWVARCLDLALDRATAPDREVTGWSIDSRTLRPGDLFFALRGPSHDGHAYVAEVLAKGAVGVVVDRDVPSCEGPILRVPDVLKALQRLASAARKEWARQESNGQVIAVTGSAGKTTSKEIIAAMLSASLRVTKAEGNLN